MSHLTRYFCNLDENNNLAQKSSKYPSVGDVLQNREWCTKQEDKYVSNGKVDQEDVDQGSQIFVGGHRQTDQDVASQPTNKQNNVDNDEKKFIQRHLLNLSLLIECN